MDRSVRVRVTYVHIEYLAAFTSQVNQNMAVQLSVKHFGGGEYKLEVSV